MNWLRASLIVGVSLSLIVASLVLNLVAGTEFFGFSLAASPLVLVGAFLMVRAPHNPVGAILAIGGAGWLLYTSAGDYARLSLPRPGGLPGEYLAAWLGSWVGALLPASLAALMLVFPDGRPPRRWRWLAVGLALVVASALIGAAMLWGLPPEALTDFDVLDREPQYLWVDLAFVAGFAAVLPVTASLISRFRRGDRTQRQQIKWLLAAAVLFAVVFVGGNVLPENSEVIWEWLLSAAIALIPIAVAFAVARYRLYDIDRIISRTVSYALVVGVLGLLVLGLITLLALFLPSDDPLVVAVATLVVFALFNPLRLRVQRVVDRRFNRTRYDAERVMEGFADSLRERVDPERVVDGWISTVTRTMQPSEIAVWIRE